jgi:HTH-type transcriptional regulator, transcriptional repressor of NAD biosynthesis genes
MIIDKKDITTGLVLSKFSPFHLGHLNLIKFASQYVDKLYVFLCVDDNECISGDIRYNWLKEKFKNSKIEVIYKNTTHLPNTSVSDIEVSKIWSEYMLKELPKIDIIFTSEKYGDYVAEFMHIKHIQYNQDRSITPISATMIRENPFKYFDYIVDVAKPYYTKKICICGTECTGKSTMSEKLARYYKTTFAKEVARDICCNTYECNIHMIDDIIEGQSKEIEKQIKYANRVFFSDTDLITTISYSKFLFNERYFTENISKEILDNNKFDLYLYLSNDIPFFQDGGRLGEPNRSKFDKLLFNNYKDKNIKIINNSNYESRFQQCIDIINKEFFK